MHIQDMPHPSETAPLMTLLEKQRAAQRQEGPPSAATRKDRIDRCLSLLIDHQQDIVSALNADFGCRSASLTRLADIASTVGMLKHAKAHLDRWMRPAKRKTTPAILGLFGAKAEIIYQPKGVVGIIGAWNFPINLTFGPLAGVLAAGNRAMIKPSEMTPATSELIATLIAGAFDESEVAVCNGDVSVGQAFAALPFDHLLFTGATSVARHIMRAASDNLVPVTLELGGKSPAIISRSADLGLAATRIMAGKTFNAGQICVAPDYVMAPAEHVDAFVSHARAAVAASFPSIRDNDDYPALISQRHYDRVMAHVEDARAKGAKVIQINPAGEDFSQQPHRKIPPTLIVDPTDEMTVMQEEIFGPLLPVKSYGAVSDVIDYVEANARPLALYWFGTDNQERDQVLGRTTSGGVTVNDVIYHNAQEELPFGGIGPSGMGSYHGRDGFREFSHPKAVYHQLKKDIAPLRALRPPFGAAIEQYLAKQIRR